MTREFAVLGLGRFGTGVAQALAEAGCAVVGVDHDRGVVQDLADALSDVIEADACDEAALRLMGIADFDSVVVAIGGFESNLLAVVALKHLGVRHVVAKALTRRQAEILHKIGVDEVILPEQEAGERLARRLIAPGVNQVLKDQFGVSAGERSAPDAWIGRTIREVDVQRRHGVLVIAIRRNGELIMAPGAHVRFEPTDVLIFAGPDDRLAALGCHHRAQRS